MTEPAEDPERPEDDSERREEPEDPERPGLGPDGARDTAVPAAQPAAARATTGASTVSGGLWLALNYTFPQVYLVVLSVVLARFLGPEDMGRQSFIAWVSLTLAQFLSQGLAAAVQRYAAEMRGRDRDDLAVGLAKWGLRLAAGFAVAGGAVVAAVGLTRGELESAWLLAALVCVVTVVHTLPHALLLSFQRFRQASFVGLVTGAVGVAGTIAALALGGGIASVFAVQLAVTSAGLTWVSVLAAGLARGEVHAPVPTAGERSPVVSYAWFATGAGLLALVVERRSEFVPLDIYSAPEELAFYSIAFGAVHAMRRLAEGASAPLVPAIATLVGAGGHGRIRSSVGRGLRLMLLVALPMTAAGVVLGPAALELVYGTRYSGAGTVLVVLAAAFPAVAMASVSGGFLEGMAQVRLTLLALGVAAVVDVAMAFALVPPFDAIGAALANVCGLLTATVLMLVFVRRTVGPLEIHLSALARTFAASAAAALAGVAVLGWLSGVVAFVAAAVGMAAVFAGLAVLLRILPPSDAEWVERAMGHRAGGRVGAVCARIARPAAN